MTPLQGHVCCDTPAVCQTPECSIVHTAATDAHDVLLQHGPVSAAPPPRCHPHGSDHSVPHQIVLGTLLHAAEPAAAACAAYINIQHAIQVTINRTESFLPALVELYPSLQDSLQVANVVCLHHQATLLHLAPTCYTVCAASGGEQRAAPYHVQLSVTCLHCSILSFLSAASLGFQSCTLCCFACLP